MVQSEPPYGKRHFAQAPFALHVHGFCPQQHAHAAPGVQVLAQHADADGLQAQQPETNATRPTATAAANMFLTCFIFLPSFRLSFTKNRQTPFSAQASCRPAKGA